MRAKHFVGVKPIGFLILVFLSIPLGTVEASVTDNMSGSEFPTFPILRIEPKTHAGGILRIGVDSQNQYVASVSLDKTVRVWELPSLKLVQILRPPIGMGRVGKLYAVAISPDGRVVATAGINRTIYVFDRSSGKMVHTIPGLPRSILHLAYSPNGQWLVATLAGGRGIRLYDSEKYQLRGKDLNYGGDCPMADFDDQGRIATVGEDGFIRLYEIRSGDPTDDSALQLREKQKVLRSYPYSLSFSPDGRWLVVATEGAPHVQILSAHELSFQKTLDTSNLRTGQVFFSVAWSKDGRWIYGSGSYQEREIGHSQSSLASHGTVYIRKWPADGEGDFKDIPAATNTIEHLVALQGGGIAFGSHNPILGVVKPHNDRVHSLLPAISDFRGMGENFLVSEDGSVVQFTPNRGSNKTNFSLRTFQITGGEPPEMKLSPPDMEGSSILGMFKDLDVEFENTPQPTLNGKPLPVRSGEIARSLAITPDQKKFLLGTSRRLRLFDEGGTEQWSVSVSGEAYSVNISSNALFAIAALGDGTIRWFRLADGEELISFFFNRDSGGWIVWTPKGYYAAAAGEEQLIGWHINQGVNRAGEFLEASQFFEQFYNPQLIAEIIKTAKPDKVVLKEEGTAERVDLAIPLALPPVVTFLTPSPEAVINDAEVDLVFEVHDRGGGIDEVRVFHQGKRIGETTRGIVTVKDQATVGLQRVRYRIPVTQGRNTFEVIAFSQNRIEGPTAELVVEVRPDMLEKKDDRVVLHLLAIGINRYENPGMNLNFAKPDAEGVLGFFAKTERSLFKSVQATQLFDSAATKLAITDKLQVLQEAAPEDVVMIYLAGHGESMGDSNWYFIPHEVVTPEQPEQLRAMGLSAQELKGYLDQIPSRKVIVIFDSCKAGAALKAFGSRGIEDRKAIAQLGRASGVWAVAASTKDQLASEVQELKHGIFTYALLNALNGEADGSPKDGIVTVGELMAFIESHLPLLSQQYRTEKQYPTVVRQGMDFPMALVQ
jgi:WD40 repeat protein